MRQLVPEIMAVRVFIVLLTFAFACTAVYSLKCYRCVPQPQFCSLASPSELGNNTVVNCTEQCTIVKTVKKDGLITAFRRSCSTNDTCAGLSGCIANQDGSKRCASCCNTDLCNNDNEDLSPGSSTPAPTLSGTTSSGTQPGCTILYLVILTVFFAPTASLIQK